MSCLYKEVATVFVCVILKVCHILRNAWVLQLLQGLRLPLKQLQLLPILHALQGQRLDSHQFAIRITCLEKQFTLDSQQPACRL